jgi:hypothetical protein
MDAETIAAFAGLIFSVLVGVAIVASFEENVFRAGLSHWVMALFLIGIAGAVVYPVVVIADWGELSTKARVTAVVVDVIGSLAAFVLIGYFVLYFKNKPWLVEHVHPYLPPDLPLVPDDGEASESGMSE